MLTSILWAASSASVALGYAIDLEERSFPAWKAPGPGDVRSPCPGLNSLANHGFIPHNGKNMTIPILTTGLASGMNVAADFAVAIGGAGILSSPDPTGMSFDLDNLNEHNFPIEHDASLSREDAYFGNDHSFNQHIFNQVLKYYKGMTHTSIPVAAAAKYGRYKTSKKRDPKMVYGPREFVLSYGETSLYLSIMGNPITGIAPLEYVKILFEQERLPYKEGWRKPEIPTTLASLANMNNELFSASPEKLPQGLELTEGTLADAFAGKDPITGKLANATCANLGLC